MRNSRAPARCCTHNAHHTAHVDKPRRNGDRAGPDGYPPNISLGFGVPRKTKSRRLNNLMYFQKISCISARSRVHFVDNSLNEGPMNESIIAHVAPSFRKPRLVPDESWPICARHAGRDIMRTGGFQSKRSLGFCLGFWGIIRYVTRRTSWW